MGGVRKPIPPLTDAQRLLVEENHDLIYWYLHRRNLNIDEWYGYMAYALCRASQIYDPALGRFSTVAYRCFEKQLQREWTLQSRSCRSSMTTVPMEVLVKSNDHLFSCEPEDPDDRFAPIDSEDTVSRFLATMRKRCTQRDVDILQDYAGGESMSEIGRRYGISTERVRQILVKLGDKSVSFGADPRAV